MCFLIFSHRCGYFLFMYFRIPSQLAKPTSNTRTELVPLNVAQQVAWHKLRELFATGSLGSGSVWSPVIKIKWWHCTFKHMPTYICSNSKGCNVMMYVETKSLCIQCPLRSHDKFQYLTVSIFSSERRCRGDPSSMLLQPAWRGAAGRQRLDSAGTAGDSSGGRGGWEAEAWDTRARTTMFFCTRGQSCPSAGSLCLGELISSFILGRIVLSENNTTMTKLLRYWLWCTGHFCF